MDCAWTRPESVYYTRIIVCMYTAISYYAISFGNWLIWTTCPVDWSACRLSLFKSTSSRTGTFVVLGVGGLPPPLKWPSECVFLLPIIHVRLYALSLSQSKYPSKMPSEGHLPARDTGSNHVGYVIGKFCGKQGAHHHHHFSQFQKEENA